MTEHNIDKNEISLREVRLESLKLSMEIFDKCKENRRYDKNLSRDLNTILNTADAIFKYVEGEI